MVKKIEKINASENKQKRLFYFAVLLLVVSIVIFSFNIIKVVKLTGKATGTGIANLTVETRTSINFTTASINWSIGSVTTGANFAILNTSAAGGDRVVNGNWTANGAGLVFENIGNQNVTLTLATGKNAASLLGGTSPQYKWNLSEVEVGSCGNKTNLSYGAFYDVNTSAITVCTQFTSNNSIDSLRIDIVLQIPSDSLTGALSDTITAVATAV